MSTLSRKALTSARHICRPGKLTKSLLQVRCAGFNGKFGSSFGQLFQAVDPASERAMAA
jgi:hypothetical protein